MDRLMAETVQEKHWYLAVGDRSIGPLTTELVARGIESGKVPLNAWICEVGASSWSALSSLVEFQDLVDRVLAAEVPANQQHSGRRSGVDADATGGTFTSGSFGRGEVANYTANGVASSEEDEPTGQRSMLPYERAESPDDRKPEFLTSADSVMPTDAAVREDFPSFTEQSGQREIVPGLHAAPDFAEHPVAASTATSEGASRDVGVAHTGHEDLGIDVTFDEEDDSPIDWKERFQSYFLVGTDVELPAEEKLLKSLRETPRVVFMHDEALWNLSLCLAFGSDAVANTSAATFFEAVGPQHASERIEWVCRTLLSKGFMPSGIPRSEGMRGIEMLRSACPSHLADLLEREAMD